MGWRSYAREMPTGVMSLVVYISNFQCLTKDMWMKKKIAEESHTSGCYIFSFGSSYFTLPPAYVHNYTFINSQPGGGKPSEILPPTRHTSLPPISTISLCLRVRTAECKQVSLLQQLAASQPRILTASHPSSLWHPHRTAHPQRHLSRTRLKWSAHAVMHIKACRH